MIGKLFKHICYGIAYGCTVSCVVNMIGVSVIGYDWFLSAQRGYVEQVLAAMLTGVAWTAPALVYRSDKLPKVIQILIHITIGMGVYLPCAFYMGWIAGSAGMIAIELASCVAGSAVIWLGFYLYYRREAVKMTRKMQKLSEKE